MGGAKRGIECNFCRFEEPRFGVCRSDVLKHLGHSLGKKPKTSSQGVLLSFFCKEKTIAIAIATIVIIANNDNSVLVRNRQNPSGLNDDKIKSES